ncbi:MAG: 4-hydroxy-tetrahydrodipicolinate reductase [Candidatus Aadella gelida]|nr:4-hydroxy-tetrahydrodipicolinate reductase [Candidatus Aadella gelida]
MIIGIAGACGKMGKMTARQVCLDPEVEGFSALERKDSPDIGKNMKDVLGEEKCPEVKVSSDIADIFGKADCLIDFTLPEPTMEHLKVCKGEGLPMVICATGLGKDEEEEIKEASKVIPIVFSPNMSIGVNLVFKIVKEMAAVLGRDFDIKVDETHHVHKKDSPSGTAKMIAQKIKESTGRDVPVEAFREGEVIGNHGIVFDGEYENIEIRHDAKSRDVFAKGAIKAAKFVAGKAPGLYTMADVLGL